MQISLFDLSNYKLIAFILFTATICFSQSLNHSPVPASSGQMILVVTDSLSSTKGYLYRFERENSNSNWNSVTIKIPVVLGKNGLAWGRGLHSLDSSNVPLKKEGDGKSPAGVFTLSAVFGHALKTDMNNLKMPYMHITDMLECIDDTSSQYYNKIVLRNDVEKIDWNSSEKMQQYGIWYALGIVVDHNKNPEVKGAGSCIFLHNWSDSNETSAGCTEMAPANLKEIVYWLDSSKNPVLVQLTKKLYAEYKKQWKLPEIEIEDKNSGNYIIFMRL